MLRTIDLFIRAYAAIVIFNTFLLDLLIHASNHITTQYVNGELTALTVVSSIIASLLLYLLIWVLLRWVLFEEPPNVNIDYVINKTIEVAREVYNDEEPLLL